ncbi:MAG: hypothetical protein IKJ87_02550 [Ruminococcus sp.]|nr:hypothetical protein [Ruminococcus sp.]
MNLHEVFMAAQLSENMQGKFELIEKITVSASDVALIKRNAEPDGTPYNFRKVVLVLKVPKASQTAPARININSDYTVGWRADMICKDNETVNCVKGAVDSGFLETRSIYAKTETERVAPSVRVIDTTQAIEKIHTVSAFTDPSTNYFPVGTTFSIYAVR